MLFLKEKRKGRLELKPDHVVKKIMDFIEKDTKAKNESKKTIVVIRNIIISVLLYFLINAVVGAVAKDVRNVIFFLFFIAFFAGMFVGTYYFKTTIVLWMFNGAIFAFILAILHFFGWGVGVQHFLMVMLLLYFFSGYQKYGRKFLFAAALCVLRFVLYFIYHDRTAVLPASQMTLDILQAINTVTIFWCLALIAYIFSKDSQELEGKLVEYNEQLRLQANTDKLTGLSNRRRALEYLNSLVHNAGTDGGFCICIADIDFFKKVNDNYGHDFGDEVLKGIAEIFAREMKDGNMAARWGGEEFLLLFPRCNGDNAYNQLVNIQKKIRNLRVRKNEKEISVTMTFGLAEYDFSGNMESTLKDADDKLYMGKNQGRDRIIY